MDHSHSNTHDSGASHGNVKSYVLGFIFSVILTALSFGVVIGHLFPGGSEVLALAVLALVQVLVHLTFFLHMNGSSAQRWNVVVFAFTVLIAAIVIGGTVWIMHNAGVLMGM
jgi:cytochrome o ubiquinol oxidase operon protein cyoD